MLNLCLLRSPGSVMMAKLKAAYILEQLTWAAIQGSKQNIIAAKIKKHIKQDL